MYTTPSPSTHTALTRLIPVSSMSIVLWGVLMDSQMWRVIASTWTLPPPDAWRHAPGGARLFMNQDDGARQGMMDLHPAIASLHAGGGNRFAAALLDRRRGSRVVDVVCSGPADVVERFGQEPFTLGTSAHAVLHHRGMWP